ncbi:MAG: cupin domain-containing protein [Clostridia bacterium]|nr:cupin domain-containing protein [Clostridia bacterium]
MRIDFTSVPEQHLEHFKGGEGVFHARIVVESDAKILKGRLDAGASIGLHCHDSDGGEIIRIDSGRGYVLYEGERIPLETGDVHYCPKNHAHSLVNDSDDELSFFAVIPLT